MVVAILTSAGSGRRLGHLLPKALVELGGVPLVVHAARALVSSGLVELVVVTAPPEHVAAFTEVLGAEIAGVPVRVVAGGSTRQSSVAAGLVAVPDSADVVLVHDAARALVPPDLVVRVVEAVRAGHQAVIPGLAVTDTIKRVGFEGDVVETVPRHELRAVQTPQGFTPDALARAHAAGAHLSLDEASAASDDAGLAEAIGVPVWVVDGHEDAFKITTQRDLAVAQVVLAERDRVAARSDDSAEAQR
ncbi:MAG: 2-C-methyl-D-erythritol 4-phosphate cytidylyltransferase [Cellulomonas sp.]|uniref:2-C-methyl-D-erythritol 4-phosphate cytidylyltransferase n=1 Tax=Cellulomonas sp. TaxID=40001 RepID=UPI0018140A46|nr:2-C-methyl-D-erythritol 4-phosphate cytidylyltransferase [Cellulomonas sp.]